MTITNNTIENTVTQSSRNSVSGAARTIVFMTFSPLISGVSLVYYSETLWHIAGSPCTFVGLNIQLIRTSDSVVMATGTASGITSGVAPSIGNITFSPTVTLVSGVQYKITFAYTSYSGGGLYYWGTTGTTKNNTQIQIYQPGSFDGQGYLNYNVFTNTAPNAPTLTGSNSGLSTTVNWNFSDPDAGDTQGWFRYQVCSNNLFNGTGTAWGDTGQQAGNNLTYSDGKPKGTWYFRVMVWDAAGVASPWSNTLVLNTNSGPNAPTITSPTSGQHVATQTPAISWTFSDPDGGDAQSAFAVEIVNSAYNAVLWTSGWITGVATRSYTIPVGAVTGYGTHYVRMQVKDTAGTINAANGTGGGDANYGNMIFYVNKPPLAPTLTTHANINPNLGQSFLWTFNDTDVGDTQSAYQVQWLRVSDSVVVQDTGKQVSAGSSFSIAGNAFVAGIQYKWQVRTWDNYDVVGPYSGFSTFYTFAPSLSFGTDF
ncbi:hypothetical protein EHS13_03090 [Paenibacillus psychroresistens]|uniref:Fibronectin type-III domain-containing protein n=1 Tax=Paenibacillus psychroresistens TaxID=1778678 RepID=A0A6B8RBM3_9BACL|nr:hypothetical protein [Paenibacillus psychroresistens]QGQ93961.1 hypothetical protein EHS13_03090 [Paenibacillus psychroresistens]